MKDLLSLLIVVLSWLAVPLLLLVAYDHWILEPKRPRSPEGVIEPAPAYIRAANYLALFAVFAAIWTIGISVVFAWLKQVAVPLSWFAAPVALWCAVDSWWLAPRRAAANGGVQPPDPPLVRAAYAVLPVLVVAVIVRMISAEKLDFSLVLLVLSVATGAAWLLDFLVFRKRRERMHPAVAAAPNAGTRAPALPHEPGTVDYARSFFPVALIVLIVRAFIFEPFRIPSDSMMPTLLDGDFIVVNKYAYGLRLPVANEKFLDTGSPQRGDVVVFRYPPDPNINYIKRLVGLPGDRIEVHDDHLVVNGQTIELADNGLFNDGCYTGLHLSTEKLGDHTHQVMSCHSPYGLSGARNSAFSGGASSPPACDRKQIAKEIGGWVCQESETAGTRDSNDYVFDVVPAGHYLMIGDNRDNSQDSRYWGLVPDKNLVGKATRIWFNFDSQRSSPVNWGRIGKSIE